MEEEGRNKVMESVLVDLLWDIGKLLALKVFLLMVILGKKLCCSCALEGAWALSHGNS